MDQRETKEWLRAIARHMNLSPSQLALNSGMAASTLTRYLNDQSNSVGITQGSIEKVAHYSGFRPLQLPGGSRPGMAEPDTIPFRQDNTEWPNWIEAAVQAALSGKNGIEPWVMKGAALDGIGVMPGDIVIIDRSARAKSGDVVLVEVKDFNANTSDNLLRLYQTPFVTTHSMRLGPGRPEHVDDARVIVAGVSVGTIRAQH